MNSSKAEMVGRVVMAMNWSMADRLELLDRLAEVISPRGRAQQQREREYRAYTDGFTDGCRWSRYTPTERNQWAIGFNDHNDRLGRAN